LAKRCRYAAEMTIPVIGRRAARFAAALADLQTVLGDHHDAIVAEGWLRAAAIAVPDSAVAAGELIALQRAENARLRQAWPAVWRSASEEELRDWF
jgi:CHAD domain-containing protein